MSELPKNIRKNGGVDVTGRRRVNLVEGTGITLTVADDPANSETDVTITSTVLFAPQPTSYIIVKSGSDYIAYNGATGAVVSTNVSLSTVFDAVEAANVAIYFAPGAFTLDSTLNITHSNVTLEGAGESTKISLGATINAPMISINGAGVVNCEVKNLWLDGVKASYAGSATDGIYIETTYSSWDPCHKIQNIHIKNMDGCGIHIHGDTRVIYLDNINIEKVDGRGFDLAGSDHKISNCEEGFSALSGWLIKCTSTSFVNCKAFASGSANTADDNAGWTLRGANAACYCSFTNCHSQDSKYMAWLITDAARDDVFVNCQADDIGTAATSDGFVISDGCYNLSFVGCYIRDGSDGVLSDGFDISADSYDIMITGCQILGATSDGVECEGDRVQISNNIIKTSGAYGINIEAGANDCIHGPNIYTGNVTGNVLNNGTGTTSVTPV